MIKTVTTALFLIVFACLWSSTTLADIEYELVSFSGEAVPGRASNGFLYLEGFNSPTFTISQRNITNIFSFAFDLLIGCVIATAVVLFMVRAGEVIISDKPDNMKRAKQAMLDVIVGLILVLSTWLIINTINPDMLKPEGVLLYGLEHMIDTNTPTAKTPPGTFGGF